MVITLVGDTGARDLCVARERSGNGGHDGIYGGWRCQGLMVNAFPGSKLTGRRHSFVNRAPVQDPVA